MTARSVGCAGISCCVPFRSGRRRALPSSLLLRRTACRLLGHRHTPAYAATIGQAVDFRPQPGRPSRCGSIGTSQGATAAVGGGGPARRQARRHRRGLRGHRPQQLRRDPRSTASRDCVAVPALIVANTGDACPASPPERRVEDRRPPSPRRHARRSSTCRARPLEGPALRGKVAARLFRHRSRHGAAHRRMDRRGRFSVTGRAAIRTHSANSCVGRAARLGKNRWIGRCACFETRSGCAGALLSMRYVTDGIKKSASS